MSTLHNPGTPAPHSKHEASIQASTETAPQTSALDSTASASRRTPAEFFVRRRGSSWPRSPPRARAAKLPRIHLTYPTGTLPRQDSRRSATIRTRCARRQGNSCECHGSLALVGWIRRYESPRPKKWSPPGVRSSRRRTNRLRRSPRREKQESPPRAEIVAERVVNPEIPSSISH